jgi:prepilin-type N-terminal cleavage/methylation domain-containing protein
MNERGLTLIELLVALAIGSFVLFGASGFYLSTVRFTEQSNAQTYLQRQAVLVVDELTRQIRPATALARGTCNADANSLRVTNSSGVYCFYQSGNQLLEDRPGGGTSNLLSGSLASLAANSFTTNLSGGTKATITFQIRDGYQNSMTFSTDVSKRN